MRITVLGGGSWGTALAHVFAEKKHQVTMLVRDRALAESVNTKHANPRYLSGHALHPALAATTDPQAALRDAQLCILAIPCQHLRHNLREMAAFFPADAIPVCASKGIERGSLALMSRVVAEELPGLASRYAVLSGPSFAHEVMRGLPTVVVLGCEDRSLGEQLREELATPALRIYSSLDRTGVECGGALKNSIALAAGVSDGLGFGHNSRAAIITRGLAEISRLGEALGAKPATFMGLSGLGDLVLTCTGDSSRNRQVGLRLGQGESLPSIINSMSNVAEGVPTTEAACDLAAALGVDLPVMNAVRAVLEGSLEPETAVRALMTRSLKEE